MVVRVPDVVVGTTTGTPTGAGTTGKVCVVVPAVPEPELVPEVPVIPPVTPPPIEGECPEYTPDGAPPASVEPAAGATGPTGVRPVLLAVAPLPGAADAAPVAALLSDTDVVELAPDEAGGSGGVAAGVGDPDAAGLDGVGTPPLPALPAPGAAGVAGKKYLKAK